MTERVDDILDKAKQLTPQERLEFFDRLETIFAGNDGDGPPDEIEAARLREVDRRIAAHERGETEARPHASIMYRMRLRIGGE